MNNKILLFSFFILTLLVSGCSLKFNLNSDRATPAGIYHTVEKGENLWHISKSYNVSVPAIKDANNLKSDEIHVGQRLLIPGAKKVKKVSPSPPPLAGRPPKPPAIIKPASKKIAVNSLFSWPLNGRILSTDEEASREKKIGIEGTPGGTVITGRAGQVFFAGETKSYSSTLIVDHLDGFYSVYGGDITVTVQKGEILAKNGVIGKMVSGKEKPVLFFEVRRGTEAVNPLLYLPKR